MTATMPEVDIDLEIFNQLTVGIEPTEPCENEDEHDVAPPAKHLWLVHCRHIGYCDDCHQRNIDDNPNQFIGALLHCTTCHQNFVLGPSSIRYLGPLS